MIATDQTLLASLFKGALDGCKPHALNWDDRRQRWITLDLGLSQTILRSEAFSVRPHHLLLDGIAREKDIDLADAVESFERSPLSHDGPRHRELRLTFARLLQTNFEQAFADHETFINELIEKWLSREGNFDLVADFVGPMCDRLFSRLTGVPEHLFGGQFPSGTCVTQLLSVEAATFSKQRLLAVNRRIGELQQRISGEPMEVSVIASILLGSYQIMKGAIANSILWIMERNPGRRLREIAIGANLPMTSIPFVDRICNRDIDIGGAPVKSGQTVILYLGGLDTPAREAKPAYFGTGAHICVGRPIAERAWVSLAAALGGRDAILELIDLRYRELDYTLFVPDHAIVRVSR